MATSALSSRLYSRSEPIGTITIDSELQPADVIANLGSRGWRESQIPEDLKKFKVTSLAVERKGLEFEMYWNGAISPFYNPVCFGIVQPYGNGSRIRAGFKLNSKMFRFFAVVAFSALIFPLPNPSLWELALSGLMLSTIAYPLLKNRTREPMRTRLIDVLTEAANAPKRIADPFSAVMSTNGP